MSIVRIKKTDNFVTLYKEALENPNLSFKAKGLWAYCLSKPNDWEFNVAHLATVSKEGEDAVYSALKELISQGYCQKIQDNVNGKFQAVDYEMYELSIFKKSLPLRDFPVAGFPHAGNPALLSIEKETKNKKESKSSPEAADLSNLLFSSIKKIKPNFKEPNLKIWIKAFDTWMIMTGHTFEDIKAVIEWLPYNEFWSGVVLSPKALRSNFEKLELEMQRKSKKKSEIPDNIKNEMFAEAVLIQAAKFGMVSEICVGPDYIEFNRGPHIKFIDKGFREQVLNQLRKMGIDVNDL